MMAVIPARGRPGRSQESEQSGCRSRITLTTAIQMHFCSSDKGVRQVARSEMGHINSGSTRSNGKQQAQQLPVRNSHARVKGQEKVNAPT